MQKTTAIVGLSVLLILGGCSARPISKTWHHLKKGYNATKQVYRATKAVAEVVNPLEYVYVSDHGEAVTPEGEPFLIEDAILGRMPDEAE
jgi:hypothetical protein